MLVIQRLVVHSTPIPHATNHAKPTPNAKQVTCVCREPAWTMSVSFNLLHATMTTPVPLIGAKTVRVRRVKIAHAIGPVAPHTVIVTMATPARPIPVQKVAPVYDRPSFVMTKRPAQSIHATRNQDVSLLRVRTAQWAVPQTTQNATMTTYARQTHAIRQPGNVHTWSIHSVQTRPAISTKTVWIKTPVHMNDVWVDSASAKSCNAKTPMPVPSVQHWAKTAYRKYRPAIQKSAV